MRFLKSLALVAALALAPLAARADSLPLFSGPMPAADLQFYMNTLVQEINASEPYTGAFTSPVTITSANANAFDVGPNGATNPTLQVSTATTSAATGVKLTSAAAGGGVALAAISSGSAENLTLDAKGTGTITLNGTGTGNIVLGRAATGVSFSGTGAVTAFSGTAVPAGGTADTGFLFSSTAHLGIFFGSGAPSLSAAQGSLYIRTDGSSSSTRLYVNSNGTTGWVDVTTGS